MKTKISKIELLQELSKEDIEIISLAYLYSKNFKKYGEDITKTINTALQNIVIIDKAYMQGYNDCMNERKVNI